MYNIKLTIGSIIVSNNTRLIIVGYDKNNPNNYVVCSCNNTAVMMSQLFLLSPNQIEKVLSLGYVDIVSNGNSYTSTTTSVAVDNKANLSDPFNNTVIPTPVPSSENNNQKKGGFIFDENGFVIGES